MNVEKIILQDLLVAIEEFHIEGFDLWADLNEDGAITIQSTGHVKIGKAIFDEVRYLVNSAME